MKVTASFSHLAWIGTMAALMVAMSSSAQAQRVVSSADGRESVAAFVYSFTQHLEWPDSAFTGGDFRVCVLGNNDLGRELSGAINGNSAAGRNLAVVELSGDQLADAGSCQVVYVSNSESGSVASVLGELDGKPVLTVSEINDFPENGGMIGLAPKGQSDVALRMHRRKIEESGLVIQSSLRDALASL